MKIVLFLLMTVVAALTLPLEALSGLSIPVEVDDMRGLASAYSSTLSIDGQKIKMNTTAFSPGGEKTELIYHVDTKRAYYVNHTKRSYILLDGEMVTGLMDRIEKLFQGPKEIFVTRKTGVLRTLLNRPCRRYDVFQGGKKIQEVWAAAWKDAGIPKDRLEGLRQLAAVYDRVMGTLGQTRLFRDVEYIPMESALKIDGYPVRLEFFQGKKRLFDIRLQFPREQPFSPSAFLVPKTYTRTWAFD
jgi:hypothetical protein